MQRFGALPKGLHFLSLLCPAVGSHTSPGDWNLTGHFRPALETWEFADATLYPLPSAPNPFTWLRLPQIHPAAGHRGEIHPLKVLVRGFSLCRLPCLLKIRKAKHFFSYGKAVLPSHFSQLNTSQGASSAIQGLDVIPWAWWMALK